MEISNPDNVETTKVENSNGPSIPGLGGSGNPPAPNMQGVPGAKPEDADNGKGNDTGLDIEALAEALSKHNKPAPGDAEDSGRELELTGNPTIDAGIQMLQKVSGLKDADLVRALGKAVEYKNPDLIDSAFIKERFGEHAAYAELLAKAYLEDQMGAAQKAVNEAYSMVGGKENWEGVSQLFTAKAPEHIRLAARALAESGRVKEAATLVVETTQNMGLIPKGGQVLRGNGGGDGALSAREFAKEYQALRQEVGNQSLESPKFNDRYQSLLSRRALGKAKGI